MNMGDTTCEVCRHPLPLKEAVKLYTRITFTDGSRTIIRHFKYHNDCIPEELTIG